MSSVQSRAYKRFLECLRLARKEASMSQAAVATHFRVPQSWVSKCESGERRVDVVELARFAKLYKKPIEFFFQFSVP